MGKSGRKSLKDAKPKEIRAVLEDRNLSFANRPPTRAEFDDVLANLSTRTDEARTNKRTKRGLLAVMALMAMMAAVMTVANYGLIERSKESFVVSAAWHAVAALVVVLWPGRVAVFCCRDLLKSVACRRWLARAVGYSVHSATTVRSPPWSATKLPRHAHRTTGSSRRGHLFTYRRRRSRAGVRLCAILAVLLGGGGMGSVLAVALTDAQFKEASWGA